MFVKTHSYLNAGFNDSFAVEKSKYLYIWRILPNSLAFKSLPSNVSIDDDVILFHCCSGTYIDATYSLQQQLQLSSKVFASISIKKNYRYSSLLFVLSLIFRY